VRHDNAPSHTAFSAKIPFANKQVRLTASLLVISQQIPLLKTTNNVAKPFQATSNQFGIEIRRPETSVISLGMMSGRSRKLKIVHLQSP
jgi:hypothetical protein